jgi:hypothetical protein
MTMTADEILEHVRALPYRERLKLVERVVHEAVETADASGVEEDDAPWSDMTDDEYKSLMQDIERTRREQPLRAGR